MKGLDASAGSIKSGGSTRRAACMRVLDIDHPDVKEFVKAKREDGRLRQFNLSLLITDDFIKAVELDTELQAMRSLGVDYAQGYLLGRPQSLSDYDFAARPNA